MQAKEKLDLPLAKVQELSEMYVFGKFEAFVKRLRKIMDIFEKLKVYSSLQESKIEGKLKIFIDLYKFLMKQ